MQVDADLEVLKTDIKAQMKRVDYHRSKDKWKATYVAVYMGAVSAVTTICIGIGTFVTKDVGKIFGIISLVTSASISVVSAWDGIFGHKKLWVNTSITLNELYELDDDIKHTEAHRNISQKQINEFYTRYKEILKATNGRWYQIRATGVENIQI